MFYTIFHWDELCEASIYRPISVRLLQDVGPSIEYLLTHAPPANPQKMQGTNCMYIYTALR